MNLLRNLWGTEKKKGLAAYRLGIHLFNELKYDEAVPHFEQVLRTDCLVNSIEAHLAKFYCGRAYVNVGLTEFARDRNQKALGFFQKALVFNPDDTDLLHLIGICLNNIGEYENAMDCFSKILEKEPWSIPIKLKTAVTFHNMKLWAEAEDILRVILQKHPDFADVRFQLGLSLMSQGRTQDAIEAFSGALSINPGYTQARLKLAMAQICIDQLERAEGNLAFILKGHPGYADAHYMMAIVKEKAQKFQEAIHHLKSAIEISPGYKNAMAKLIITHYKAGERELAKREVERALSTYPGDSRFLDIEKAFRLFQPDSQPEDPHEIKARTLINLEEEYLIKKLRHEFHRDLDIMPNVSEIISMFNNPKYKQKDSRISEFLIPFIMEQINRNPTYPDLYNSLGTQLSIVHKFHEAEHAFRQALELNPAYVAARINLIKTLYRNKKYQGALEHGRVLAPQKLPYPDLYLTLAKIEFELKQFDDAIRHATEVLRLQPGMDEATLLLAEATLGQGNGTAALDILTRYLKEGTDPDRRERARRTIRDLEGR